MKYTDMTGKACEKCRKGVYAERSIHDDMDGIVRCAKCLHAVKRHRKIIRQTP